MLEFTMPKLGLTMEQGRILKWLKGVGETLNKGDLFLEVETDKASVDVESPVDGILREVVFAEGTEVPVGVVIAQIEVSGMKSADPVRASATPVSASVASAPASVTPPAPIAVPAPAPVAVTGDERGVPVPGRVRATPAVRKRARELGVDLSRLEGTGPLDRIILRDLITYASEAAPGEAPQAPTVVPPPVEAPGWTVPVGAAGKMQPLSPMRRAIIRQMNAAAAVPQFRVQMEVEVSAAEQFRKELGRWLQGSDTKITLTDFLVQAAARALVKHPGVNASYVAAQGQTPGGIWLHSSVNVGIAVAVDGGLRVPVIRDADQLSLGEIARRRVDLVRRAREGTIREQELTDATFTISNLGPMGVDSFDAIINPPQAAILATGRVREAWQPQADGSMASRLVMTGTLTSDHRVLDGAQSAAFLGDLLANLREPIGWRIL